MATPRRELPHKAGEAIAQPPISGPPAYFDPRRTLEFYRYYEPFEALSNERAVWVDLNNGGARTKPPTPSPDKALTAFCQLVAIQLQAQRVLVMCFDAKQGYVLAEATKSISPRREADVAGGGDLWLGHSIIPRGFSTCEHTVNLPANEGSNKGTASAARVHIINDFRSDSRFCNRPYVTGGPRARFYAGAPIKTPGGINIGALCVLDDQPRTGLTDSEIDFLTDMAATITEHLEAMRARAEYRRGTQMSAGLSAFIQGMSSNVRGSESPTSGASDVHSIKSNTDELASQSGDITMELRGEMSPSLEETVNILEQEALKHGSELSKAQTSYHPSFKDRSERSSKHSKQPFQMASRIIQCALDTDGVIFFDASVSTFGGLVDDANQFFDIGESDDETCGPPSSRGSNSSGRAFCAVLGEAHRDRSRKFAYDYGQMKQRFFRSLLRKYPRGKIWMFPESDPHDTPEEALEVDPVLLRARTEPRPAFSRRRRSSRTSEIEIADLFPGVRSLALVPMWDHAAERWRAGAILYTYSPTRTFSYEGDMNFMTAFCDVIFAELARSDTVATLKAKSAFTSSITHELRTPLHGILGTVEHLRDELPSSSAAMLLTQIETCGKVLLDVIDNLLALSAMDHQATRNELPSNTSRSKWDPSVINPTTRIQRETDTSTGVALNEVTEQAVDAIVHSYFCLYDRQQTRDIAVTVVIDIDPASTESWRCCLPVGAWDRVCINLIGNALKFTSKGYVSISLKQKDVSKSTLKEYAVLTIQDTGCGMSKDFMSNSLFQAFAQEDSFSDGMGLGMSVAAKIVRAIGGSIDVQSTHASGTLLTVRVPLLPLPTPTEPSPRSANKDPPSDLGGVSVGFLGNWNSEPQSVIEQGRHLLLVAVKKSMEQLGLFIRGDDGPFDEITMNLVFESDLPSLLVQIEQARKADDFGRFRYLSETPLLIICKTQFSARILEASGREFGSGVKARVEYLAEPCGPKRLAAAVRSCLELQTGSGSGRGSSSEIWKGLPVSDMTQSTASPRHTSSLSIQFAGVSLESPITNVSPELLKAPHRKTKALCVMLVDDNSINLRLLDTYCGKQGHRSITAMNGLQAVELYKLAALTDVEDDNGTTNYVDSDLVAHGPRTIPEVILMDINMPIMDGFEAARHIRSFENTTGVTPALIIAITGVGSEDARQQAFVSGIDLFFQKPVKLKELTKVLEERFPIINE